MCWSLIDEYIVYISEENGGLSKVNLINEKTLSIKKISSSNLVFMNINPIRLLF